MPLINVHGKLLSNLFGKYSDAYEKKTRFVSHPLEKLIESTAS